jgi:O-antigen/teichoic acid export membrane protein
MTAATTPPLSGAGTTTSSRVVDSFLSSLLLLLLLTIGQKALGFVRSVLVCRWLPAEELGTWSLLHTMVLTVSPLLLLSIPACFGRYFAIYESRGQLRGFIRQAAIVCFCSLTLGGIVLWLQRATIAQWALGDPNLGHLILAAAVVLLPFGVFSFVMEMILALRQGRLASNLNLVSTLTLTVATLGFLFLCGSTVWAVLYAFALSSMVPLIIGFPACRRVWRGLPADQAALDWSSTWSGMLPVLLLFFVSDLVGNLFFTVDKFMIVNLYQASSETVLYEVGTYEAMQVLPAVMMAVVIWVARTLLPYTARAWEEGQLAEVRLQTHLAIKLVGWCALTLSLFLVAMAGPLCHVLFNGKYDTAIGLMPALAYFYLGCSLSLLWMNYFWCAGVARWSLLGTVAGLVVNAVVNYYLVPQYGIAGAAWGTACGIAAQQLIHLVVAARLGLGWDLGLVALMLGSSLLVVDHGGALAWLAWLALLVGFTGVYSREEQSRLHAVAAGLWDKVTRRHRKT